MGATKEADEKFAYKGLGDLLRLAEDPYGYRCVFCGEGPNESTKCAAQVIRHILFRAYAHKDCLEAAGSPRPGHVMNMAFELGEQHGNR